MRRSKGTLTVLRLRRLPGCVGRKAGVGKQRRTPHKRPGWCRKRMAEYCPGAGKVLGADVGHRTSDQDCVGRAWRSMYQVPVRCRARVAGYVPDAGKVSFVRFQHHASHRAGVGNGSRDKAEAPGWDARQVAGMVPVSARCLETGRRVWTQAHRIGGRSHRDPVPQVWIGSRMNWYAPLYSSRSRHQRLTSRGRRPSRPNSVLSRSASPAVPVRPRSLPTGPCAASRAFGRGCAPVPRRSRTAVGCDCGP